MSCRCGYLPAEGFNTACLELPSTWIPARFISVVRTESAPLRLESSSPAAAVPYAIPGGDASRLLELAIRAEQKRLLSRYPLPRLLFTVTSEKS